VAKPKSLTLPLTVDRALKSHACQHNSKHRIAKGDLRLKVAAGRSYEHYCAACARTFLGQAIERLQKLHAELEG
jgi:hypothetical protein